MAASDTTVLLSSWTEQRNKRLDDMMNSIKALQTILKEENREQRLLQSALEEISCSQGITHKGIKRKLLSQQNEIMSQISDILKHCRDVVNKLQPIKTTALVNDANRRQSSSSPNMDGLRVAYINIEGARAKRAQIQYILHRYTLDVLFVAEAKLTSDIPTDPDENKLSVYEHWQNKIPDKDMEIAGYYLEREDRRLGVVGQGGGGMLVYVTEMLRYDVIEKHTAIGRHPLQYIYIHLPDAHAHLVGAYLPPPYKEETHIQLMKRFADNDGMVILGDMNVDYYGADYPFYKIEIVLGYDQNVDSYTRISLQNPNGTPFLSEKVLDHVYTRSAAVIESGVIRCGISDHDLIFCTLDSSGCDYVYLPKLNIDVLIHDVPIIAAVLLSGPLKSRFDQSQLVVKDTQFWLLAHRMETRRLQLCELVEGGNTEKWKRMTKTSIFASELNALIRCPSHHSCKDYHLSEILNHKRNYDGRCNLVRHLNAELQQWTTQLQRGRVKDNIFLGSELIFFRFCFPLLSNALTRELFVNNPHNLWTNMGVLHSLTDGNLGRANDKVVRLVLQYHIDERLWHPVADDTQFWNSDIITDGGTKSWRWSDFIAENEGGIITPEGMIEFDTLIAHQYLKYTLQNCLDRYSGHMLFGSGDIGQICLYLTTSDIRNSEPHSQSASSRRMPAFTRSSSVLHQLKKSLKRIIKVIEDPKYGIQPPQCWYVQQVDNLSGDAKSVIRNTMECLKTTFKIKKCSSIEIMQFKTCCLQCGESYHL